MLKRLFEGLAVLAASFSVSALPSSSYLPEDAFSSLIHIVGGFGLGVLSGWDLLLILGGIAVFGFIVLILVLAFLFFFLGKIRGSFYG